MLKIDTTDEKPRRIERLKPETVRGRLDLCTVVSAWPDLLFGEIDEDLLLVATLDTTGDGPGRHSALLAVDRLGTAVLIVAQHEFSRSDLQRAMRFSFRDRGWKRAPLRPSDLEGFLQGGVSTIDKRRRVVLVGARFDFDTLIEAGELNRNSSAGQGEIVACVEASVALDPIGEERYLSYRRFEGADALRLPPAATRTAGSGGGTRLISRAAAAGAGYEARAVTHAEAVNAEPAGGGRLVVDGWLVHDPSALTISRRVH